MSTLRPLPPIQPGPPPDLPERPEGVERPLATGLPAWRPWTGVAAVVTALLVATLLGGLVVAPFGTRDGETPPGALIGATLLQDLAFVGAALFFARLVRRPRAGDFGLRRTGLWRALGIAVGIYAGFSLLSGLWITALGVEEEQQTLERLGVDESTLLLVLGLVIVTVLAPVAEEVLFRGYMFTALRNWRGLWPAAIVSGATFGVIHAGSSPPEFLVPLAVLGIGLCLLYAWTRSLYPCIALHAVNNAVAFSVAQEWTWQVPLTVAGATAAALLLAAALARALGRGPLGPAGPPADPPTAPTAPAPI
jgi:membrane protease YdiL (CAAX protease family)